MDKALLSAVCHTKIENLMLHKSDSLSKRAIVVQTAKTDDEQIRPD
jgi:hypothetical protein